MSIDPIENNIRRHCLYSFLPSHTIDRMTMTMSNFASFFYPVRSNAMNYRTSRNVSTSRSSSTSPSRPSLDDRRTTTENATIQIKTNHVISNEGVIHLTAETKGRCSPMLICYACASCGGSQAPCRLIAVRHKSISHFFSSIARWFIQSI